MLITFIYRLEPAITVYYGKYFVDYLSDDHEGLDTEIKPDLEDALDLYRALHPTQYSTPYTSVTLGILSLSSHPYVGTWSTDAEIPLFGYYRKYDGTTFVHGIPIHMYVDKR